MLNSISFSSFWLNRKLFTIATVSFLFLLLPASVFAVPTIYYFPANFDGNTQRPQEVSTQGAFPLICDGGTNGPRLAGLDLTRLYAGAASCPSNGTERFAEEVEYIFLVDDTSELSPYLADQFRTQNLLQEGRGRSIVRPTVLQFPPRDDRSGFKIFVVGDMDYRLGNYNSQTWFAHVNSRFASDAIVASVPGAGGNDIAFIAHGTYYSSTFVEILNPSIEKIMAFSQKQLAAGGGGTIASAASSRSSSVATSATSATTNAYIDQCRAQSVPIPPTWNPTSGTTQWQRRGTLANPFIATGLRNVEVWTYASTAPSGICIALPRMAGPSINTDIEALGIICQSEDTGKACFWDNVVRPTPDISSGQAPNVRRTLNRAKITGANTRNLSPTRMSDGYNLEENCTQCHRGYNVFITRIGTPLNVSVATSSLPILDSVPAVRYQPLSGTPSDPNWANPASTVHAQIDAATGDCTNCHSSTNEIAQPTQQYCLGILNNSIGSNMPDPTPCEWNSPDYINHVNILITACRNLGVTLTMPRASGCP